MFSGGGVRPVLVLDLSLPGTPGAGMCRESAGSPSLPIIILMRADRSDGPNAAAEWARMTSHEAVHPRELSVPELRTSMRASSRTPLSDVLVWRRESGLQEDGILAEGNLVAIDFAEFKVLTFMIRMPTGLSPRSAEACLGIPNYPEHAAVDNRHVCGCGRKWRKTREPLHFRTVHVPVTSFAVATVVSNGGCGASRLVLQ